MAFGLAEPVVLDDLRRWREVRRSVVAADGAAASVGDDAAATALRRNSLCDCWRATERTLFLGLLLRSSGYNGWRHVARSDAITANTKTQKKKMHKKKYRNGYCWLLLCV